MNLQELKSNTEFLLKEKGIEVNSSLPTIEELDEVSPQSSQAVASRACALTYVVGMAFGADRSVLIKYLKDYELWDSVTYKEKRMLEATDISKEEVNTCSWITENIQALAWCLGLVDLDHYKNCDDDLAQKLPFKVDPKDFIKSSTLQSIDEIQKQSDLLYRMHWNATHARLNGKDCPYNERVVYERRRAIDWVYGVEEEWEDVPMDT